MSVIRSAWEFAGKAKRRRATTIIFMILVARRRRLAIEGVELGL